jgi:RHS repeat-associated protein
MNGQKHIDATGSTIIDQAYTRDRTGNITAIAVAGSGTTSYALDALYRLKTVTAPTAADSEAFSYDRLGNRLTATSGGTSIGASGSTTNYYVYYPATQTGAVADYTPVYNNRLKEIRVGSVSGTIDSSFAYNNEGRMTAQAGSTPRSYMWDAKGRLTSEGTETYAYDPLNHRIRRTGGTLGTLDYFLEGEHLESVYKGSKIQEKYFRGLLIDELVAGFTTQNGKLTPFFFQHDQVNSVVAVSKPNGGTQQRAAYKAFGEDKAGSGTPVSRLKYTGREDDGTGLYQYRARYYDPKVGRFISEDPKKFEAGPNFYAYVRNNPVNSNDPSGMVDVVYIPGQVNPVMRNTPDNSSINRYVYDRSTFAEIPIGPLETVRSPVSMVVNASATNKLIEMQTKPHYGELFSGSGLLDLGAGGYTAYNDKHMLNKTFGSSALYNYQGQAYSSDYVGNIIFGDIAASKNVSLGITAQGSNYAQYMTNAFRGVFQGDEYRDQMAVSRGYINNMLNSSSNNTSSYNFGAGFLTPAYASSPVTNIGLSAYLK